MHLRDNPRVKTREIGLLKGVKQGKSVLYDGSLANIADHDKTGKLYKIEIYNHGKLDGESKHFDPRTGKLIEFMRFDKGNKTYSKNITSGEEHFYAYPMSGQFWSESGSMVKNKQGFVTSLSCPQKKSNNNLINTNCGWSHSPGPVVKLKYGTQIHQMRYCKGRPCGNRKSTSSTGKKSGEVYINKKKQRVDRKYYASGKLKYEHISNPGKGAKNIIREFYKSGKPKSIAIMRNRKTQDLTLFYQNGAKKYHGSIAGKIVNATHYYDNGRKSEEYQFKTYPSVFLNRLITRGRLINTSREYYETGRLEREIVWKNNHKARMRQFDKNGKLIKDESYYPDGSRK